jgi:TPR repeat protein
VGKDEQEAVKWYTKSAEQGFDPAKKSLEKLKMAKDIFEAFDERPKTAENIVPYSPELIKKAEAGDAEAQFQLGYCYYNGEGVAQNYKEALAWMTKSAEQGFAKSQLAVAYRYYEGEVVAQRFEQGRSTAVAESVEKPQARSDVGFNLRLWFATRRGVEAIANRYRCEARRVDYTSGKRS